MGHPTDTQIMNKLIEIGDILESKLNELESSLDSLSSTISSLESDINSISSEVSSLESAVSDLQIHSLKVDNDLHFLVPYKHDRKN